MATRLCRTVISLSPQNRQCDPSTTDKIPNPRAPLNQWMGSAWTLSDAWSLVQIRNQESGWRLRDQWHWCGQDLDCQQCHQPIRKLFSDCVHPFVPLQHIALTLTCINMIQPESNALQDFENMSNERSLPGKSCFEVSFNLFCCCSLLCVFNHCYFHRIMDGSIIHTKHRSQDVIAELEVALSRE